MILKSLRCLNAPSDHKGLEFEVSFENSSKTPDILIPDKKLATIVTLRCLEDSHNSTQFFSDIERSQRRNKHRVMLRVRPRRFENKLLQRLLDLPETSDIGKEIRNYWEEIIRDNENKRFSVASKEAFDFLKKVYKYHQYDRRDGSIVNSFMDDNNSIITDPSLISDMILENLQKMYAPHPDCKTWRCNYFFPSLRPISDEECESICGRISTGKGLGFDLVSDVLFSKSVSKLTAKVFKDLWSHNPNQKLSMESLSFKARLIALNKDHPNTPKAGRFRPIVVSSPIVKLIEGRFLPKLESYLIERLCPSQIGFVRGYGIQVNIVRAIRRIKERTDQKQKVYGLFVDFSNAYNTVRHDFLFQRLEGILDSCEIDFLKALYSRSTISVGKHIFQPKAGVSQGSIISPALFDIYSEDLIRTIINDEFMSPEDVLMYADDILILTPSRPQISRILKLIEGWSERNNMKLNKSKSGIVLFRHRRSRRVDHGTHIDGIQIQKEYKYLGCVLNETLSPQSQMDHIKRKSSFLTTKLRPLLSKVSLSYRKNLWQTFVQPLFEFTLALYHYETTQTWKLKLETLQKIFERIRLTKTKCTKCDVREIDGI